MYIYIETEKALWTVGFYDPTGKFISESDWANRFDAAERVDYLNGSKDKIPRRNRLDLNTPAEKAIYDAMQEVENLPADVRLTESIMLLSRAKELVSDFVDGKELNKSQD